MKKSRIQHDIMHEKGSSLTLMSNKGKVYNVMRCNLSHKPSREKFDKIVEEFLSFNEELKLL